LELAQVCERASEFDVIHCHIDYLAFPLGRMVRTPTIHTLHGRLDLPYYPRLFSQMSDVRVVSISNAQRAPLWGVDVSWVGTVYHGLALSSRTRSRRRAESIDLRVTQGRENAAVELLARDGDVEVIVRR